MTAAERARKSRARRAGAADAAERVEVTFWPLLDISGSLARMSIHIKDHPEAADAEVRDALERAEEALELISVALWDGCTYGRRKRAFVARYWPANFLNEETIRRMKADHLRRIEAIAARSGAMFIRRTAQASAARAPMSKPKSSRKT